MLQHHLPYFELESVSLLILRLKEQSEGKVTIQASKEFRQYSG